MFTVEIDNNELEIEQLPTSCPFCHISIVPKYLTGFHNSLVDSFELLFRCPGQYCQSLFICYYRLEGYNHIRLYKISKGELRTEGFSDTINNISKYFSLIFNEASAAEQNNLKQICGMGYRKALEFLIKEYAILKHPEKREDIEKKLLGKVIDEYVNDQKVKSASKRAAWLGNDETHFIRKWVDKNLSDLKKLIALTVHWLEMEALTESFETDMPG